MSTTVLFCKISVRAPRSYKFPTTWLQSAFGPLSRSRSTLRVNRSVGAIPDVISGSAKSVSTRLRGHTPYALTKCPQTRMNAEFCCVTGGSVDVTLRWSFRGAVGLEA